MNIFEEYNKKFGECVPLYMIPDSWSPQKINIALERCIEKGKPFNLADYDSDFDENNKY